MHQHFEPEDRPHRSPFRTGSGDDLRYWEFYSKGYGVDPDLARERMDALRWEQETDEPLFYTRTRHTLDFKCQCRNCTKLHTITMQDASFLRTMGIMWKVPNVDKETAGRTER